jgi:hypothetical protein
MIQFWGCQKWGKDGLHIFPPTYNTMLYFGVCALKFRMFEISAKCYAFLQQIHTQLNTNNYRKIHLVDLPYGMEKIFIVISDNYFPGQEKLTSTKQ